jgi:hypothetical protein
MTSARPIVIVLATLAAALMMACGAKRVAGPSRPGQDLIVLLPDSESGSTGRARVSNQSGSADLDAPRAASRVIRFLSDRIVTLDSSADDLGSLS